MKQKMSNEFREKLTPSLLKFLLKMEDWKLVEVGRLFNLSRQRVHQIKKDKLDKVK